MKLDAWIEKTNEALNTYALGRVIGPVLFRELNAMAVKMTADLDPEDLDSIMDFGVRQDGMKVVVVIRMKPVTETMTIQLRKVRPTHTINVDGIEYDVDLGINAEQHIFERQFQPWIRLRVCYEKCRIEKDDSVTWYFDAEDMHVRPDHISVIRPWQSGEQDA